MPIFTVSPDLLENIEEEEKIYLRDILFVFTNSGTQYKVAKDKKSEIIDIYRSIENNADIIKTWLELMSYQPARFEKIDVDLSDITCKETKFIELCNSTLNNKDLIVYSKQNFQKFICNNDFIEYKNQQIKVLDKDDANSILNNKQQTNFIIQSQVAMNGSQINESNNN